MVDREKINKIFGYEKTRKTYTCPICKREYKYFKWLVKHIQNYEHKMAVISGGIILEQQTLYDILGIKKPIKSSRRQEKLKKYLTK